MERIPAKPYADFPLFADKHSRQWRKDVWLLNPQTGKKRSKAHYFGTWHDDPEGQRALREWLDRKDAILAGIDSVARRADAKTLGEVMRSVRAKKEALYREGKLALETYGDYLAVLPDFIQLLGEHTPFAELRPEHFAGYLNWLKQQGYGPHRTANAVKYVKHACRIGAELNGLAAPIFGAEFTPPSTDKDTLRMQAERAGMTLEEVWLKCRQLRWLLRNASARLRLMILLGLNCGYGPSDLARLRWGHVNLERQLAVFPRPKTGCRREAYLWKAVCKLLRPLKRAAEAKLAAGQRIEDELVFQHRDGTPLIWRKVSTEQGQPKVKILNRMNSPFRWLVGKGRKLGILPAGKIGYYRFRHQYYTVAEDFGDLNALHRTMGHKLAGQGGTYKDKPFPRRRLKAIALYALRRLLKGKRKVTSETLLPKRGRSGGAVDKKRGSREARLARRA